MVSIKFQADVDLHRGIVTGVVRRQPKIDFQTDAEAGLAGVKDIAVLDFCAKQKRILVTHDRRTMPTEFAAFLEDRQSSGVIIASKKMGLAVVIEQLLAIWTAFDSDRWINRIVILPIRDL